MSLILLQAATAVTRPTPQTASPPATSGKICRDMITSSSRLRPVIVCKTRTAWQRWERCHSATRYCAPPTQPTVTVVSMPGDKLVCKYIKTTGSRLEQQKVCGTKSQWEVADRDTQDQVRDVQSQSMAPDEGFINPGQPTGGPR